MALFSWQKKAKEDGSGEEFHLPDELVTQIKTGAEAAEKVSKIETMLEELKNLQVEDRKARTAATAEAAAAAARKVSTERQAETDAEIEELMLTNPKEAIRKATENQSAAIMMLRADNLKREVFEDVDKFKYYAGDIKREVDVLIAGQSLSAKNDPSVVENCYHTVMGKHADEIAEGKIKNRFAGAESSSRGTSTGAAGSSGTGKGEKRTYETEYMKDIERAAKQVGIKTADYLEMLEKEGVV